MATGADYVIVGAGAAGCVLARRLVDLLDCRVVVLEAGGLDDRPEIGRTDLASTTSMWTDPTLTWQHRTVPQPGLGGRSVTIAQGRVLGGGSAINAMMYVRGNRRDFDHWRDLGNPGWGYRDVLPAFVAAERFLGTGDPDYRGTGGPIEVVPYREPSAASLAFLAAAAGLGFREDADYNAQRQEGTAFLYQSTRTGDGRRSSTAMAYLHPALAARSGRGGQRYDGATGTVAAGGTGGGAGRHRVVPTSRPAAQGTAVAPDPQLTVHTGALVTRILWHGNRATGVEYVQDGLVREVRADEEVILAAGALASPKLLMLSGIGPAGPLREHGIVPVVDLPGVGRNLHDHLLFGVAYQCRHPLPVPQLLAEAGLFTTGPAGVPDLQFFFGPVFYADERYRVDGPAFTAVPILVQPLSRGTLSLRSADPAEPPVVDPGYLTDPVDVDVLVHGLLLARELVAAAPFDPLRGRELAPGPQVTDRAGLAGYVRDSASTVWHPVGTCKMGTDAEAVVGPELRVHGTRGLRVVDASVMPTITSGNTNAPTIMIAEKAVERIVDAPAD